MLCCALQCNAIQNFLHIYIYEKVNLASFASVVETAKRRVEKKKSGRGSKPSLIHHSLQIYIFERPTQLKQKKKRRLGEGRDKLYYIQ